MAVFLTATFVLFGGYVFHASIASDTDTINAPSSSALIPSENLTKFKKTSGVWSVQDNTPVTVSYAAEEETVVTGDKTDNDQQLPVQKDPIKAPTVKPVKLPAAQQSSSTATKTVTKKAPVSTKKAPVSKKPSNKYSGATIGGFFVYSSVSAQVTADMLDGIKATGADTAITFGFRLRPVSVKAHVPMMDGFTSCVENNKGCLVSLYKRYKVKKVFTYDDKESWSSRSFVCSGEKTVTADNGDKFSVIVLGKKGACSKEADLVVVKHPSSGNATTQLVKDAKSRGMKVIIGLPAPVASSVHGWLPDMSYQQSMTQFTDRFLQRVKKDYGNSSTISGFYHHTEMPLVSNDSWSSVRSLYEMQNKSIKKHFPKKFALISPFIDARRNSVAPTPLNGVAVATQKLAATGNGVHVIIAPQDGQGTGKVGAYSHAQRNNQVDSASASVAGKGSYAKIYYGSTQDYMREVVKGARGSKVTAWVNIELMSATTNGAPQCAGAPLGRGKASIKRVKNQVKLATVPGVKKTIGFMWQPYATCGKDSLAIALSK